MKKDSWKIIEFIIGVLGLLLTYLKDHVADISDDEPFNTL